MVYLCGGILKIKEELVYVVRLVGFENDVIEVVEGSLYGWYCKWFVD